MPLSITQSCETSTFNLKHLSGKTQHPKAQQMTCWDNGFESLTSTADTWLWNLDTAGVWSQPHLLQQQITIHDKIPKATTMTKDAMITYSTLHSASKTPEINTFWHLIQLTVHVLGTILGKEKARIRGWEPPDPLGQLKIKCVDSLGSFHHVLVYKICFPLAEKPLYRCDRRELWFIHPEWTQLLVSAHWEGLKGTHSSIKHLPRRWDKGLSWCHHLIRATGRWEVPGTVPTLGVSLPRCPPWGVHSLHTTVAFAVPHLHPEEILHPEGVTHTALGEGVTAPVLRAVQLTGWGPKPARWTKWLTGQAKMGQNSSIQPSPAAGSDLNVAPL